MKCTQAAIGQQGREAIGLMAQEVCQGIDTGGLHFKISDMRTRNALGIKAVHGFCEDARGANGAALWGVEAWKGSGDACLDVENSR